MAVGGKKPRSHAEASTDEDDETAGTSPTKTSRDVKTDKYRNGGGGGGGAETPSEPLETGTFLRDDVDDGNHIDDNNDDDEEEEESGPDYQCGWFCFSCPCLKPFRSPKWALVLLCLSSVMQGFIVNGLLNVVISTIEKRFHLTSKESGMIRATNSVAQMICTFPVSYFGGKGSKPKYLGVGVMSIGIGAFIFSLPHFITQPFRPADIADSSNLCVENIGIIDSGHHDNVTASAIHGSETEFLNSLKFFFFLGQVFHGAGSCPLWTLGVTYLDENLPTKTSSLYVGIFYAFAVLGPALGYIGGGGLLEIYTDFHSVEASELHDLNSKHPNWVGLWWIGFLIASVVSIIVGFFLFSFPTKLPGWKKVQKLRVNESVAAAEDKSSKKAVSSKEEISGGAGESGKLARLLRPVVRDVGKLTRNYPFIALTFNQATEGFLLAVFSAFMPKFLESQFGAKPSDAAFFVGIIVVFCGATGMIFGGWVIKKFNMSCYAILVLVLVSTLFQIPQMFAFLFMSCDRTAFSGIDYPPAIDQSKFEYKGLMLEQSCNRNCECAGVDFNPICGSNKVVYFSPCHAGCRADVEDPAGKVLLKECSCIPKESASNESADPFGTATSGNCAPDKSCKNWEMYPFLAIFALLLFPMISMTTPTVQATLRTVPTEVKSVALGIQLVLSRLLGAVPGPPVFGGLLDSACLLSQGDASGGGGACVMYNQGFLALSMFSVGLIWKICSLLFIVAASFFYRSHIRRRGFFDPGTLAVNDAQSQPSPHTPVQEVGEEDVEVELVSSL